MRGTLILVEVSRLPRPMQPPQQLWLWWHGPQPSDLAVVWRAYIRRFDLEHTFRFLKQALNWMLPHVRHPEQADRWTWIVVLAYMQLRLTTLALALRHAKERLRHMRTVNPCMLHTGWLPCLALHANVSGCASHRRNLSSFSSYVR
jgi:hypothetical protein